MPLPDTMFCAQQIHIPPELPDILKQFTKAAIRTQPADVLQWSAGYFSALSRGDPLPVKDRIEMPVATQKTDTGLTQGLLKVLHKQCSHKQYVELADLEQKWKNLCLPVEKFRAVLQLDPCEHKIEWMKFLALGCSMLGGSLNSAMKHLCEILTKDEEGGPARIPFETFCYIYRYLSGLDPDASAVETQVYLTSLKENIRPPLSRSWAASSHTCATAPPVFLRPPPGPQQTQPNLDGAQGDLHPAQHVNSFPQPALRTTNKPQEEDWCHPITRPTSLPHLTRGPSPPPTFLLSSGGEQSLSSKRAAPIVPAMGHHRRPPHSWLGCKTRITG